jgi:hypothetical protein
MTVVKEYYNLQGFSPENCTPKDVKLLPFYFPHIWTFEKDIRKVKIGSIIKTNFLGAPIYGHAALVTSNPRIIRYNGTVFCHIQTTVNEGSGGSQCWYIEIEHHQDMDNVPTVQMDNTFLRLTRAYNLKPLKIFILNPIENVNAIKLDRIYRQYEQNEYSTLNAIRSAFKKCFTVEPLSEPYDTNIHATYPKSVLISANYC